MAEPGPRAVFHTFAASTIDLTVYYWYDTKVTNPLVARDQGIALLKAAFDQAGIEMPFPTQMVLQPSVKNPLIKNCGRCSRPQLLI